jgi:molecular chaperone DnaK (HSP70)
LICVSSTVGFLNINKQHHGHSERISCPSIATALAAEIGVGIDLGTTNSAVAFLQDNVPRIIEIPNNGRTMKSVVAFDENYEPLVGKEALEWEHEHRETAYRHVKRVIGTSFNNLSDETREVVPHLVPDSCGVEDKNDRGKGKKGWRKKKRKGPSLIRVLEDADNYPTKLFSLNDDSSDVGKSFISPEDVSSCVVEQLLNVASEQTGDTITRAVIGIPAYFNDAQKEATVRAAKACGMEKVKLLREPEAAALAYGFGKDNEAEEELVLVFDLGGGTYDVSVLTIGRGLTEIVCTSGNSQLGGTNFDTRIAKHLSKLVNGCCKTEDSRGMVLQAAESIRISLSNNKVVSFALPTTEEGWLEMNDARDVIAPPSQAKHFEGGDKSNSTHSFHQLSRREMEKICKKEFQDLIRPMREVAIMSGAMLPGDASPTIVELSIEREKELSQLENFYYDDDVDGPMPTEIAEQQPETTTTDGGVSIDIRSAKKAQQKGRKKARETAKKERKYREESRKVQQPDNNNAKVRSEGISGRPISRIVLVGGATRMPTIGRIISSLTGVTPQRTVDPDEAVALGCAVHVGVLDGKEEMGVVLNPMKAALLRAAIEKERREGGMVGMFEEDDDDADEFTEVEYI